MGSRWACKLWSSGEGDKLSSCTSGVAVSLDLLCIHTKLDLGIGALTRCPKVIVGDLKERDTEGPTVVSGCKSWLFCLYAQFVDSFQFGTMGDTRMHASITISGLAHRGKDHVC